MTLLEESEKPSKALVLGALELNSTPSVEFDLAVEGVLVVEVALVLDVALVLVEVPVPEEATFELPSVAALSASTA